MKIMLRQYSWVVLALGALSCGVLLDLVYTIVLHLLKGEDMKANLLGGGAWWPAPQNLVQS